MKLTWQDLNNTSIMVVLAEGEMLGNMGGPSTFSVPLDPANTEYAAIQALEPPAVIEPFVPPVAAEPGSEKP